MNVATASFKSPLLEPTTRQLTSSITHTPNSIYVLCTKILLYSVYLQKLPYLINLTFAAVHRSCRTRSGERWKFSCGLVGGSGSESTLKANRRLWPKALLSRGVHPTTPSLSFVQPWRGLGVWASSAWPSSSTLSMSSPSSTFTLSAQS